MDRKQCLEGQRRIRHHGRQNMVVQPRYTSAYHVSPCCGHAGSIGPGEGDRASARVVARVPVRCHILRFTDTARAARRDRCTGDALQAHRRGTDDASVFGDAWKGSQWICAITKVLGDDFPQKNWPSNLKRKQADGTLRPALCEEEAGRMRNTLRAVWSARRFGKVSAYHQAISADSFEDHVKSLVKMALCNVEARCASVARSVNSRSPWTTWSRSSLPVAHACLRNQQGGSPGGLPAGRPERGGFYAVNVLAP